jgi:hypothetical protein
MSDKPSSKPKERTSRSGVMPRPVITEPHNRHEPPMPTTLPEMNDDDGSGTTGIFPIVPENIDNSAEREDDPATGN